MRWLHPLRVVRLRGVTALMSALWAIGAILALWQGFPAGWLAKALLLIVAAYGIAIAVLIITHTEDGHEKVEKLLTELRAAIAKARDNQARQDNHVPDVLRQPG